MDLPPAGPRIQKNHFVELFGQKVKIDKNLSTKKSTNSEKSVHGTGFWIKRQTGNVLLIVIFVIRKLLTDVRPMKVHFTEKIRPELAGPASTF